MGGSIVLARCPAEAAGPLPIMVAEPARASVPARSTHPGARWAGEVGFAALMIGLAYLVLRWLTTWPVVDDDRELLAPQSVVLGLATAAVVAWSAVLATGDRTAPGGRPWWRPFERWVALLRDVVRPTSVRRFAAAVVAAVPFNVVAIAVASAVVAAVAYGAAGSSTRDSLFEIAFMVLALPPIVVRLFGPKETDRV